MPSLQHSPVPTRNPFHASASIEQVDANISAIATDSVARAAADIRFAKQCIVALVLLTLLTAIFDSEAATDTTTALNSSTHLSPEAVTELSVTASTHANLFPQGIPYVGTPLNCKTDTECERKAARKIASLEKQIVTAKKSIGKHGAAILRLNDKLQAMQKEIASLLELPAIESLKDADAGTK